MDAITLSTAQLTNGDQLATDTAWCAILSASMSNFLFKAGIVAMPGDRQLFWRVASMFGLALLAGGAVLWLWPA